MRHLYLAIATTSLLVASLSLPYASIWERISVASAWICMAFLCGALLIGPLQRMQGKPPQLNIYLRRDIGIWGALTGLLHFVAGNVFAMNQSYVGRFVEGAARPPDAVIREQLFSGGAVLGTVVAILFLLLLGISSDWAMRRLGPTLWKRLQRSAHIAVWFTVAHGVAFQLLESRYAALTLLIAMGTVLLVSQLHARRLKLA